MRFEILLRTLLLGVVLSVGPARATELAAPAAPVGGADTLQSAASTDVANGQQRRSKKARIKGGKRAAALKQGGDATSGGSDRAASAIPESTPPEPQSIALRGVRG